MPPIDVKFNGGLNTATDFLSVPEGQCLTFSDVVLNYGILQPRTPQTVYNNSSVGSNVKFTVLGWMDSSTFSPYIYALDGAGLTRKIYRSVTWYQDALLNNTVSFSDVSGGIDPGLNFKTYDALNGILCFTGDTISPFKFTSNTTNAAALGGTPPSQQASLKAVNNYLFISGNVASNPSRVYWSALADPETWPAANYLDFKKGDADWVRALGSIGTDLFIFKGKGIGKLSTTGLATSPGPFTVVWDNLGCMNARCLDNLPDGRLVFWGSDYDIYITDGYTVEAIAKPPPPIPNVWDALVGAVNGGATMMLRYYPRRNEIVISSPFDNLMFAYDIKQKYWRKITGFACWALQNVFLPPGVSGVTAGNVLFGSDSAGNVLVVDRFDLPNGGLRNSAGVTLAAEMSTSLVFPENFFESGLSHLSLLCSTFSTDSTIVVGYDNGFTTTPISLNVQKNRFDLPLIPKKLSNSQAPSTIQIKINSSYTGAKFYRIFLDSKREE